MAESKEYKKLKCLFCGYEQASCADRPRCNKCKSRRMNIVLEFSAEKILNKRSVIPEKVDIIKNVGVETMAEQKEVKRDFSKEYAGEYVPREEKKKSVTASIDDSMSDIDKDILGDDEEDE